MIKLKPIDLMTNIDGYLNIETNQQKQKYSKIISFQHNIIKTIKASKNKSILSTTISLFYQNFFLLLDRKSLSSFQHISFSIDNFGQLVKWLLHIYIRFGWCLDVDEVLLACEFLDLLLINSLSEIRFIAN